MRKDATIILIFALVAYTLIVVSVYYTQSYVIFQSRGPSNAPPKHFDIDEAVLTTPDGEQLYAWWLRTENANKTILYFQENGTNLSHRISRLNTFDGQKTALSTLMAHLAL